MRRWWCFYDGSCPVCQAAIQRFAHSLRRLGGRTCSLQKSPLAAILPNDELMRELRVWDGRRLYGGAQAIAWMAGRCWFLVPLPWLLALPGPRQLSASIYQAIATRRHCLLSQASCAVPQ